VVWRNVQVARPSESTSGGQCGAAPPAVVDDAASAVAVAEAMACAAESPSPLLSRLLAVAVVAVVVVFWPAAVGGFQFRKEVQTLQGLPSGPRTRPGGSGRRRALVEGEEKEDCEVEVSVLLVLVLVFIVAPRPAANGEAGDYTVHAVLRHRAGSPAGSLFLARSGPRMERWQWGAARAHKVHTYSTPFALGHFFHVVRLT